MTDLHTTITDYADKVERLRHDILFDNALSGMMDGESTLHALTALALMEQATIAMKMAAIYVKKEENYGT